MCIKDQGNLAQWSYHAGLMLAYSAISSKKAGIGIVPQVAATAHRAIMLLSFAKQNNIDAASETLGYMKESGFVISEDRVSAKQSMEKIALIAPSEVAKICKIGFPQKLYWKNYSSHRLSAEFPIAQERPGANIVISV
jgi:pentatricopeptide repeat protein